MNALNAYLPPNAADLIRELLKGHDVKIFIKNPRKTKLGDYRYLRRNHQITINANLNPYAFLLTLLHEIAHLYDFAKWGKKPPGIHGASWKSIFGSFLKKAVQRNLFPLPLAKYIENHAYNPPSATFRDLDLARALRAYDETNTAGAGLVALQDLPENALFYYGGKGVFRKLKKRRKNFLCMALKIQKYYVFNPLTEVEPIDNEA